MNDSLTEDTREPKDPQDRFVEFLRDHESRIKALEDALTKQRAVNEALLADYQDRVAAVAHLAVSPDQVNAQIIAALREALK